MYDSANYMQNMLQTVCFRVTYLTPRQAGLESWFRSSHLGVPALPGPFALASLQWNSLRQPVLGPGPGPGPGPDSQDTQARANPAKWSLRAQCP